MKYLKPLIFTFVLLFAVSTNSVAQQHLKFMGIPLTGTIDQFQKKLAAKRIYPNRAFNRQSAFGSRMFDGIFEGRSCSFHVYYTNSKVVYRAKAVYSNEDEDLAERFYNDTKNLLQTKYSSENFEDGEQDGYPTLTITVTDETGSKIIGFIDLYRSKYYSYGMTSYSVHVDYTDYLNNIKHNNDNMNDL